MGLSWLAFIIAVLQNQVCADRHDDSESALMRHFLNHNKPKAQLKLSMNIVRLQALVFPSKNANLVVVASVIVTISSAS